MRLVLDASALIDLRDGGVLEVATHIRWEIVVSDVTVEELQKKSKRRWKKLLHGLGFRKEPLPPEGTVRIFELPERYPKPARNDLFALALAEHLNGVLVTGDADLRRAAEAEGCRVHGTLWLLDEMVAAEVLAGPDAADAVDRMLAAKRRLPARLARKYQNAWREGYSFREHQEVR